MPPSPESPYALSKYWTEQLAVQFSEFYDLDTVALRYFNVYGPRQDPTGSYAAVIPTFIDLMTDGDRPTLFGDGEQTRDVVHVDDVVEANIRACQNDVSGEVLNLTGGEQISINQLVDELNQVLGTNLEPVSDDPRPGDVRHSVASIEKARRLLDFEPAVGVREGFDRTVDDAE